MSGRLSWTSHEGVNDVQSSYESGSLTTDKILVEAGDNCERHRYDLSLKIDNLLHHLDQAILGEMDFVD